MAHGCGGGGTSRQVTCVLVLPPKGARRWTSHALCPFDSFLQPRWFAEVIWTIVNLLARHLPKTYRLLCCGPKHSARVEA